MSDLKVNNITSRDGNHGPIIAGVSTVSSNAFMIMPVGNTEIRGAGSGRGVMAGGAESLSSPYTISDRMQYITIATTGNATDFGDALVARGGASAASNSIRGLFAGGYSPSLINGIEFITIATTGNGSDFGDMTFVSQYSGGCSDSHGGL